MKTNFILQLLQFNLQYDKGWKYRRHFPDGHPEIRKTIWPLLNTSQIRTLNYRKIDLTPPGGQKLFLNIMIFSTFDPNTYTI